jgi:hypothetical protein
MFKLLTWMQNFNQSTWDREMLYADRSSKVRNLYGDHFCEKRNTRTWRAVEC